MFGLIFGVLGSPKPYFPSRSLLFIDIQRLSQSIIREEISSTAEGKFIVISKAFLDFSLKPGRTAHRGENFTK
jgi:hypothetical protein